MKNKAQKTKTIKTENVGDGVCIVHYADNEPDHQTAAEKAAVDAATYVSLTAFFTKYDAIKKKHDSQQITDGGFVDEMIDITKDIAPPKKRKPKTKEPPKYKRITIEQYDEYQTLKAK